MPKPMGVTSSRGRRVALVALCAIIQASCRGEGRALEVHPSGVPSAIIAYGLASSYPGDFHAAMDSLRKRLEKLDPGLNSGFGWIRFAFIVQNNITNHFSGFERQPGKTLKESGVPYEGFLFVTTPVESLSDKVIVVLSLVSPERMAILAVDSRLNVELLYDSDRKNIKKCDPDPTPIGSIYGITVVRPGFFVLQERSLAGARLFSLYQNRKYTLDVTKGQIDICKEKDVPPRYEPR